VSIADKRAQEIYDLDLPTNRLAAAALTLCTVPGRSELFGRAHAWYAVASTQAAAAEYLMDATDGRRRRIAAASLAKAGYEAGQLALRTAAEIAHIPALPAKEGESR
jgi:hypothetical protein